MDIRSQLLVEHSKANTNRIVGYIGSDLSKFETLLALFLTDEYRVSQRAAMAVSACFDKNPELFEQHVGVLIQNLNKHELHVAVKRNTVRILQFMELPESYQSALFDHCLNYLANPKETVAVKAFSMKILFNICKNFPDLKAEVVPLLEDELSRNQSPGVQNRGKKILKALNKL